MKSKLSLPLVLLVTLGLALGACKKKPKKGSAAEPQAAVKASVSKAKVTAKPNTFAKKMPKVGTTYTTHDKMNMTMTLKTPDGKATFGGREVEQTRHEVLAVDGATITKLKVTVLKKEEVSTRNGKKKTKSSPLVGKTFILAYKDGAVQVTDGAGKAVSAELTKALRKEHNTFGKPDRYYQNLPTNALKPGQKVPAIVKAMREEMKDEDEADAEKEFDMKNASVVYRGTETYRGVKVAVFDQTMTMIIKEGNMGMKIHAKAVLRLRADTGWKVGQEVAGELDMMGQKKIGRLHAVETYTYK